MTDLAEFRGYEQVPRDRGGRWVHGPGGGAPAGAKPLPDAKFADITIAYRPRHPDGHADPGEVVWARVPFEDDPSQSKDRPVLIVGRTKDGKNLVGLQLTSKPGTGRDGRESIGVGDWDKSGRPSYLKYDRLIQVDDRNYRREGSYMKKAKFQEIANNLTKRNGAPAVALAVDGMEAFDSEAARKSWETRRRNGFVKKGDKPAVPKAPVNTTVGVSNGFSQADAEGVVSNTMRAHIERDIAEDFGLPASAVWKQKRGHKLDETEALILGVRAGDPDAIRTMATRLVDRRLEPVNDPEFVAALSLSAATEFTSTPAMAAAHAKFGSIHVVAASNLDGASGKYMGHYIAIGPMSTTQPSAPLKVGGLNVDSSMGGTIRHEYGHHVHTRISEADQTRWDQATQKWGGLAPNGMSGMEEIAMSDNPDGRGISVYARANGRETFAETFAVVTHRDFDRAAISDEAAPLVDLMLEFIG